MTLLINPPAAAIPVYPWMKVQEFYLGVLEVVSDSQAAIDKSYAFEVGKNRIQPYIEDEKKTQLVNCLIGAREDKGASNTGKDVGIKFSFEIMARAHDEAEDRAGPLVVERAYYLAAMVEFGLNATYNNLPIEGMNVRGMEVSFIEPEEIRKSENLFMFGTVVQNIDFGIDFDDYKNLPALKEVQVAISGNEYIFNANTQ